MTYAEIITNHGIKNSEISVRFGIPMRTLQNWANGDRQPPEYVLRLLEQALKKE